MHPASLGLQTPIASACAAGASAPWCLATRAPCAGAQGLAKIDRTKLMARVLGLVAPLIAQPVSKGALSTLYTATAPELAGATPLTGPALRACDSTVLGRIYRAVLPAPAVEPAPRR